MDGKRRRSDASIYTGGRTDSRAEQSRGDTINRSAAWRMAWMGDDRGQLWGKWGPAGIPDTRVDWGDWQ